MSTQTAIFLHAGVSNAIEPEAQPVELLFHDVRVVPEVQPGCREIRLRISTSDTAELLRQLASALAEAARNDGFHQGLVADK